MRTRRKKQIQLPITARRTSDGSALPVVLLALAMIVAGGLVFAYLQRPDLLAHLATNIELGRSLIATPHL